MILIACSHCSYALRVTGPLEELDTLVGQRSDYWPDKYPCFHCDQIAAGFLLPEVSAVAMATLVISDVTPQEAFAALHGLGTPTEQTCCPEVLEQLFGNLGITLVGNQLSGTSRFRLDALALPGGTKVHFGASPQGAVIYRIVNRHSYVAGTPEVPVRDVQLAYKRVGHVYQGTVNEKPFEDKTFAEVMMLVRQELTTSAPNAGVSVRRTEREGLLPVQLSPDEVKQLRENPEQYIAARSPAPVVLKTPISVTAKAKARLVPAGTLRTGHDTLADAFGERIYLRARTGRFEHPVDGRWYSFLSSVLYLLVPIREFLTEEDGDGWITIDTVDLLQMYPSADRFFLPRAWNEPGPWIPRAALQEKYDRFIKEKSDVTK